MAMTPKLVGFVAFLTGAGTLSTTRAYNCTVSRTADGDYDVQLGNSANGVGGIDETVCDIAVSVTPAGAAAGAGTARLVSVIHTSDSLKRVQIRDDTGAFAAITAVNIAFRRLPPLPTP